MQHLAVSITRARLASLILKVGSLFKIRDTLAGDTPAIRAMSLILAIKMLSLLILLHYVIKCSKISKKAIEKEEYGNNKILIICSLVFIFVIY